MRSTLRPLDTVTARRVRPAMTKAMTLGNPPMPDKIDTSR